MGRIPTALAHQKVGTKLNQSTTETRFTYTHRQVLASPVYWTSSVRMATGRFYHHSVPIVGVLWDISKTVRLRAVYPEPALTVKVNKDWETGVAGQLIGGGFRTDKGSAVSSKLFAWPTVELF